MKCLLIHNKYQQAGGEDTVVAFEKELLLSRGNSVRVWELNNSEISTLFSKFCSFFSAIFSLKNYFETIRIISEFKPDVVHVHNFFPLLSPSVHMACTKIGVKSFQTLHNYRLSCVNSTFFRNNKPCFKCIGTPFPIFGIIHKCYKNSYLGSLSIALMILLHRVLGTWQKNVTAFILLSEKSADYLSKCGIPQTKIKIKPNSVPSIKQPLTDRKSYAIVAGRLTPEKGILMLAKSWEAEKIPLLLKIIGDGPDAEQIKKIKSPNIEYLGQKPHNELIALIAESKFLVFPSLWPEVCPMIVIEALSTGTPVLVAKGNAAEEMIRDKLRLAGLIYDPEEPKDLSGQVKVLLNSEDTLKKMQVIAAELFNARYTEQIYYKRLMEIYATPK